jgi:hypothetical protein
MYGIYESGQIIARFVAPLSVRSNGPVYASDTLSLKRDVVRRPPQRWEIDTRLEPLSHSAEHLFVNLVTKGNSEIVNIIMPQNLGAVHSLTTVSEPMVLTAQKGATMVSVVNNFANASQTQAGNLSRGTFIQFDNHSKIYLVTNSVSGTGTMGIYPKLKMNLTESIINYTNVVADFLFDLDTLQGMSYVDGILMDVGTVRMVEKV